MSGVGLVLLVAVAVFVPVTGLPAFLVVMCAAVLGALAGVVTDVAPLGLFTALPSRVLNLLENDLMQSLPLYVLVGALLNRLRIAESLFNSMVRLLRGSHGAPAVAGLTLGALLGPMNGSVGASVVAISRSVAPRLDASGMPAASRHALVAVASTLGVVVPPSLVLILLADGMLHAHYVAVHVTERTERIVNTQDIFRGALVPAALFLVLSLLVAAWQGRRSPSVEREQIRPAKGEAWVAAGAFALIIGLLVGVATGRFLPVEGAATAAFILLASALASGRLRFRELGDLLLDVMTTSGALFALLVAATSFTLVFRILGTDKLLEAWVTAAPISPVALTGIVLGVIVLTAVALDAFEIIFVLIPILMPPLLMRVPDASWVAVLVLLALQASFMLPPIGYALLMTRGVLADRPAAGEVARRILPFLACQLAVLGLVLAFPALVHLGQPMETSPPSANGVMSEEEAVRRMGEMVSPSQDPEEPDATIFDQDRRR